MIVFIDLETIPDQTPGALEEIKKDLTVKAPDLLKPKLIEVLSLGDDGKFKTVPELKEMWVEAFGDQAKHAQAKEKWLKTSFDGSSGEICCIGVSSGLDGIITTLVGTEKKILTNLNKWILRESEFDKVEPHPTFVAHKKNFDLPFLHKRLVINNIKPAFKFHPHARHRAGNFCTMEEWAGFNGKVSLNNLCKYLGIKGKMEGMDGSQVWPEYEAGNIGKISKYCSEDVRCLIEVYKRLTFEEMK